MDKPKRPLSVRIAQILLSILSVIFLVLLLFVAWWWTSDLASRGIAKRFTDMITMLLWLAFVLLSLAGVLGMAQRRSWGRWLSVAALSVILIFFVVVLVDMVFHPSPLLYYSFAGGFVGIMLIVGGLLWLILHLAFSRNIAGFLTPNLPPASATPPPPPESFDD